ncbi:hypothetical protein EYZ11_010382 [Aspergillus tanneri]|uniref:Uncharacterized protein n=1 Tax=Aspergillus tanneri TaxID=1220188 RepID=A0A4S3J5T1_9EURO|nr:hypothetical protein EYZ11_010382 [Aspergillus tanneri]
MHRKATENSHAFPREHSARLGISGLKGPTAVWASLAELLGKKGKIILTPFRALPPHLTIPGLWAAYHYDIGAMIEQHQVLPEGDSTMRHGAQGVPFQNSAVEPSSLST